jgi:hypothetical protein
MDINYLAAKHMPEKKHLARYSKKLAKKVVINEIGAKTLFFLAIREN